ncbi:MAG: tetratricopeptide repeat protein [Alphaproteobacteria bacterium]|nr:tetratricopeptide repeat protein [Alphaproteobacteria bacterium]
MSAEELAQKAMMALNEGDPRKARALLVEAMEAAGQPRADLMQALAVVLLQLGEPAQARGLLTEAVEAGWKGGAPPEFITQCYLGLAAAAEDLDDPAAALKAYEDADEADPGSPRVRSGRANLLLGLGRLDEALNDLDRLVDEARDEEGFLEGAKALAATVRAFREAEVLGPRDFLVAHRDSYVEFFDDIAKQQEEQGWMAECARMIRDPEGHVVYAIPEGARPYAAVRVDLVDPSTGQAGQIGDQPMVVAVASVEPLARAVVIFPVEGDTPFTLWVSSQCPWDQLPVQVLFEEPGGADALDEEIAAWYSNGFEGRFGTPQGGRFHYVSDPIPVRDGRGVVYHLDLGRSSMLGIEELLSRLVNLSRRHRIQQVILGRGFLAID